MLINTQHASARSHSSHHLRVIAMDASAKYSAFAQTRNAGIDALRATLTLLVVFHHAAITYGASGSWFYTEIKPSGAPSSLLLTIFCAYNQAFFMARSFSSRAP
jgi:peptidoglycan/LPS O-acetylase OafA/YrhL